MAALAKQPLRPDLCVIGAGAAGLTVASSAALVGARVVLIEAGDMGGDCLNRGCVPSKTLIAAARLAHLGGEAGRFGLRYAAPDIDGPAVMAAVRARIAAIAPVDSEARYRAMGVTVLKARARFTDARTVIAGDQPVVARRFVIATGARPAVPGIPGLDAVPYLTSDTIFVEPTLPARLLIIGGGAIGCELGQAFRRLGSAVTIVESAAVLGDVDADAQRVVRHALLAEGITLHEYCSDLTIARSGAGGTLAFTQSGQPQTLAFDRVLIATGRAPNIADLGLEAAGVSHDAGAGIAVSGPFRTTNRRIHAIGDCIAGSHSTHAAAYQAGVVVKNALFRLPGGAREAQTPRVIFTDPEVASIGMSEDAARRAERGMRVLRSPFADNDRARIEGAPAGLVKLMVGANGRILGVVIAGRHAGELIAPWGMAIGQKLTARDIADLILPYPTLSEASRRAALQAMAERLRSPWVGRVMRWLRVQG